MTPPQPDSGSRSAAPTPRAPARRPAAEALLRAALWLTLGGVLGAWILFGRVVAPTAFEVLPSSRVAGSLIGPVLESLHLFGAAAGVLLALLAAVLRRGPAEWLLPLAMAAACLYSQFGLAAEMAEIQDRVFGPQGSEALAARFSGLHRLSVGLFIGVGVAALALAGLHARDDARAAR